jgi:hypothetical protein
MAELRTWVKGIIGYSYIGPSHVGPVVHSRQLATAVWLRVGARADSEIPRRYILSACRRVLTLRKNIVEKVHQLKSTLTEQQASQLELLLTESRSTQVLMDKTMGSAALIDSTNIAVLLEEMRKAQIAEHTRDTETRLRDTKKEHEKKYAALADELAQSQTLIEQNAALATIQAQKIDTVLDKALVAANRSIAIRRLLILGGVILSFVIMSLASYFGNVADPLWASMWFVVSAIIGIMFLFSSELRDKVMALVLRKRDRETLEKTLIAYGLDPEMIGSATYSSKGFERIR